MTAPRWLRNVSIRRKLAVVILAASVVASLLAALAVVVYETTTFRPRTLKDVRTWAKILELIMPAPLAFQDQLAAEENLRTLSAIPRMSSACVYTPDGGLFASYQGAGTAPSPCAPQIAEPRAAERFEGGVLKLWRRIDDGEGRSVGSLYLEYRLPPLLARLPQYGIMLSVVLIALVAVSLLVSSAAQRLILAPIWELASTAMRLTVAKDYSVRAIQRDNDEIGALTETFNEMLDTIEENVAERRRAEEALREHSRRLEERVEERTRELRRTQERLLRQERLAFLGQLAGGVSHELRRPLATIGNAIYYLETIHGESDAATKEHVEVIRAQINTMEKIIHDLLDSLRIRPESIGEVDLGSWLEKVLERHPPPDGVEVRSEMPADLPAVWMDAAQIEQVVSNLIVNAYQAMAEGGELRIGATAGADGTTLHLSDTGCGISDEHLKSVFEPLFTTKARGIGLGLTISKNFVEANGGRLEVESAEGEGTTFSVYLPTRPPSHLRSEEDAA